SELKVAACFEYVGQDPNTSFVKDLGITNEFGYIIVDENCETSINKLFAAGDVIEKNIRQITTAVADGSIAALNAVRKVN
ncbi:MAG: FAD-dependent oxidoreductase, partial [Bacilli bacterium]